jgi:glutamine amidotransferase
MAADVVVIDYGIGNLFSVRRSLEHCGASVSVSSESAAILAARRVVLPGVGAFPDGMATLREFGLEDTVRSVAAKGTPLLGVCLGMQMLFDESEEFTRTSGLGLIPGRVVPVGRQATGGEPLKIPHIGWAPLVPGVARKDWRGTPLAAMEGGEAVYFVHSFMGAPADAADCLADCFYGGHRVTAAVARGNIVGYQFHPEKSGEVGLRLLRAFLSL